MAMIKHFNLTSIMNPKGCSEQFGVRWIKTFPMLFSDKLENTNQRMKQSEDERKKNMLKKGLPKRKPIPGVKDILLVASGKGGVGKSTAAVNIALGIKGVAKKAVGLLDADIFGPSIPKLMNIQQRPELNKDKFMLPPVNYGLPCMSMGFLVKEDAPVVWRGLIVMQAIQQLLWQVDWGDLDLLIVDMPPGTGDVPLSIIQNVPVTGAVVITTPQDIALTDVRRGIGMFEMMDVPVLGVVQNMSSFFCPKCSHETNVFGSGKLEKFASSTGTEVLGNIPLHEKICDLSDHGWPVVVADPTSPEAQRFLEISSKINGKLCSLKAQKKT